MTWGLYSRTPLELAGDSLDFSEGTLQYMVLIVLLAGDRFYVPERALQYVSMVPIVLLAGNLALLQDDTVNREIFAAIIVRVFVESQLSL